MEIRSFRGWRYCGGARGDVNGWIAPPYDVLDERDKQKLLAGGERNIVAADLPHCPPTSEGPDEVYAGAAELLRRWQADGVLRQDERPGLYVYQQEYRWAGKTHVRRAMICGIRATELGQDIIPHEHTFAGPKADRLKLTQHTRMQLSPIFAFYRDPQGQVGNLLQIAATGAPDLHGTLGGVSESLWTIDADKTVQEISAFLRPVPAYIADGHHRYTTALNYCRQLRDAGTIDEGHEANFVMFALVAHDDPGLLVLPTHRIVSGLAEGFTVDQLIEAAPEFSWRRRSVEDLDFQDIGAALRRHGPGAMAVMGADPAEIWIATLQDRGAMDRAAPDQTDAWRSLDVAILHKLLIDRALTPWRTDNVSVQYTPDAQAVLAACRSGRAHLGVCLQGTPLEAVETIADQRGSMPHKSTYFYPKLATGMVLKPLE